MEKEYKVEIQLEVKDIFQFLIHHSFTTWQGRTTWILGILALIGAPIMAFAVRDNFSALIFLIVAIIYLAVTPFSFYSNAQRQMLSNSVFKNKIVFRFEDDFVHVKQYTGEVSLFWNQLEKIEITKQFILLYVNSKQAFIIPKRFVETDKLEKLEKLLLSKQSETKKQEVKDPDIKQVLGKENKNMESFTEEWKEKAKQNIQKQEDTSKNKKRNEQKKKNGNNRNKHK